MWDHSHVYLEECVTMREACRAIRYTVQPLATFSSCSLMTDWTSADREDWLATKITVAKETCDKQRVWVKTQAEKSKGEVWALQSLTRSSCCLSVDEWLATLYRSTKSPSMPSPNTGRWVAMAARLWHMRTREESHDKWSWPSRNSTAGWLRWGRLFNSLTNEVRPVWSRDSRTVVIAKTGAITVKRQSINSLSKLCLSTVIASYFKCSLSTGAVVLATKHQKGLHTKNCVLLQLNYIWKTNCYYKINKSVRTLLHNVGRFVHKPFSGQEMTMFERTMTPWAATARLLW